MDYSKDLTNFCKSQIFSNYFIEKTRKINIYLAMAIIIVGIIGNSMGMIVFLQKSIRLKPTSIYLLCLIISDSFYLAMHFFEDTLKAFIEHYIHETDYIHEICLVFGFHNDTNVTTNVNFEFDDQLDLNWAILINIIDRYDFFCRFINFARYFFRFTSAYIIVAFTMQRMFAIKKPFSSKKYESKMKMTTIIITIIVFAFLSALWVPIILQSRHFDSNTFLTECYIREGYNDVYFIFTNSYIIIIMFIPMIIIFVCNSITIFFLKKQSEQRFFLVNRRYLKGASKANILAKISKSSNLQESIVNSKEDSETKCKKGCTIIHLNSPSIKKKNIVNIKIDHKVLKINVTSKTRKINLTLLLMSSSYVIFIYQLEVVTFTILLIIRLEKIILLDL